MNSPKLKYNLGIVGAGRQGMSILEALVPPRKDDDSLRVLGVADLNPEAPGILYARRHNLLVTADGTELLKLPDLDIIVNATGRPEVSRHLKAEGHGSIIILDVDRARAGENFCDLLSMELSAQESAPLRLGIVGGGKAAQRSSAAHYRRLSPPKAHRLTRGSRP